MKKKSYHHYCDCAPPAAPPPPHEFLNNDDEKKSSIQDWKCHSKGICLSKSKKGKGNKSFFVNWD